MRVIILKEEPMWVAQCLEHDIAAQGVSIPEVKKAFLLVLASQIVVALASRRDPQEFLDSFGPAPDYYHERFELAERLAEPIRVPDQVNIPPAFMQLTRCSGS